MTSFIDLYGNIEWSDKDITNRTEAMIASVITPDEERIINRKIQAVGLGEYVLDADDVGTIEQLKAVALLAHSEGIQARNDMKLLKEAWDIEVANNTLFRLNEYNTAQSKISTITSKESLSEIDTRNLEILNTVVMPTFLETDAATRILANASEAALALVNQRSAKGVSYRPNVSIMSSLITEPEE